MVTTLVLRPKISTHREERDEQFQFLAVDDEEKGRVLVEVQVDLLIKLKQTVYYYMIDRTKTGRRSGSANIRPGQASENGLSVQGLCQHAESGKLTHRYEVQIVGTNVWFPAEELVGLWIALQETSSDLSNSALENDSSGDALLVCELV